MIRFILSILLAACSFVLNAQSSDTIFLSALADKIVLEETPALQVHPYQKAVSFEEVRRSKTWKQFDSIFLASNTPSCWISFTLHNDTRKKERLFLSHGGSDSFQVFFDYGDSVVERLSGDYVNAASLQYTYDNASNGFTIDSAQTMTVYAKVYNEYKHLYVHSFYLETREYYTRSLAGVYIADSGNAQYHTLIIGALFFSALFIGLLGFWFKDKSFLYYVLFIGGALLYLLPKATAFSYTGTLTLSINPYHLWFVEGFQYLFYAAYVAFGASLMGVHQYKTLRNFIRVVVGLFLLYAFGVSLFQVVTRSYILPNTVFAVSRLTTYVLSITAIIWIVIRVKSPVKPFFIAASITFVFFTALAAYSNLYRGIGPKPALFILPMTAFKTAVLLDALIFAAALGYKMYLTEREKRSHFQSYIQQLEVNDQLVRNMNVQLEQTVAERTAELEAQKEKQLRLEYERQLAQLEMQSLRSQMNPHFIFNSLNSIRYQIQTAQYKNASDYLMRFSKLLRLTLENSRRETVTLTEELALTKLYLDIEGQRFGDAYQYHIDIAPSIDTDEILLPPLLLQPYAENAIKHGLMNSTKPLKMIQISVAEVPGGCSIRIQDNGIGRQASHLRKQEAGLEHQSLGMNITAERIRLFALHENVSLTVHIEDVMNDEQIDGTLVVITCKTPTHV